MAKLPKIEIRQRKGSKGPMTGSNTEVLIDGKPLKTCTKLKFEVEANSLAKINLELVGEIVIYGKIGEIIPVSAKLETCEED